MVLLELGWEENEIFHEFWSWGKIVSEMCLHSSLALMLQCGFYHIVGYNKSSMANCWEQMGLAAPVFYGDTATINEHLKTWHAVISYPDSRVHGADIGPIWGRHDPGGPHVGPVNLATCIRADSWPISLPGRIISIHSKITALWRPFL